MARLCLAYALLCALIGLGWQFATVQRNYGGNWTALFCVGANTRLPDLPQENIYRFANSTGFDGQFYYLIAHDPSPTGSMASNIDTPDLRYERILIPLLAYTAALGRPAAIAAAFITINLIFLFLGSWWLGRAATFYGGSAAWGLAFLLVPAVPISLDRMTVDLALTALAAGAFYFYLSNQTKKMLLALALACLTRDTGVVIVAGFAVNFLMRRQWHKAFATMAAAVPFALWFGYVMAVHPLQLPPWLPTHPFRWTWGFLADPKPYPFSPAINAAVRLLDLAAMAGLVLAMAVAFSDAFGKALNPARLTNLLFAGVFVYLLALDEWTHVYDFGRIASPLAMNLLLYGAVSGRLWMLAPALLMSLRVAAQLAPQAIGIISHH